MKRFLTTDNFWLSAVLIAHVFVKFLTLPQMGVWGDEAFSIFYCQQEFADLLQRLRTESNPPLYFFLLNLWIKLGNIEPYWVKSLSVLFSLGTAWMLFKIGRLFGGLKTSLLISSLFLLSNLHFDFSHEVRTYSLTCFLTVASFFCFLRYLESGSISKLIYLTILNALLGYAHYIALLVPVVQFSSMWFLSRSKGQYTWLIGSFVLSAMLFLPLLGHMLQVRPDEDFWLQTPSWADFQFVFFKIVGFDRLSAALIWPFILSPLLFFKVIRIRIMSAKFKWEWLLLCLLWFILPLTLDFIVAQFIPVFRLRYILFASFGIYIGLAYILEHIRLPKPFKPGIYVLLIGLCIATFKPENRDAEKWDEMASTIQNLQLDQNDIGLVTAGYKMRDLAYYLDRQAFSDYKHFAERMAANNFFACNDATDLSVVPPLGNQSVIILVKSHHQVVDPNNSLEMAILSKGYVKCDEFGSSESALLALFKKQGEPCQDLEIIESEELTISCYDWKVNNYIDKTSKSKVTEYLLKINTPQNCDWQKQKEQDWFNIHKDNPYSATVGSISEKCRKIKAWVEIKGEPENQAELVITASKNGERMIYKNLLLKNTTSSEKTIFELSQMIQIPGEMEFKVYIYNLGDIPVKIESMTVQIWENN